MLFQTFYESINLVSKKKLKMKIWQQLSGIFKKVPSQEKKEGKEPFLKKYQSFREVLLQNNSVLELMADIEEKMSAASPVDRTYMGKNIGAIADGVKKVIDNLNLISENAYSGLDERFREINSEIEKFFAKREIPVSSYTMPFDEITAEMSDKLGNKNANLGEVRNRLRIPTPDGFAISTFAYKRFMEHNELLEKIDKILSELRMDDPEILESKSSEIQEQILSGEIPSDLEEEILRAYTRLCNKYGQKVLVALRSSAIHEDGDFSFAGQYATFLNVPSDLILQKYKEVLASLFTPKALFYPRTKGLNIFEHAMSVGVLKMIDAKAAGVIYSRDPIRPEADNLVISAVRGMGRCVVEGVLTPETYTVLRYPSLNVVERKIPEQTGMTICRPDGKVEQVTLPDDMKGKPCLDDEQIKILAVYAVAIENHYKYPQDIEWAIDLGNRPYIVQARPLLIPAEEITSPVPARIPGYNILIDKGVVACKGIGFGKAYVVKAGEDTEDFPEGAVLVAKHTSTKYVTVLNKAGAIITDIGGATVHLATLAREFQIPMIVDTEVAAEVIKNGQGITVDAINCIIYEGRVKELSEFSKKRIGAFKTPYIKAFEKILKRVITLNLINPEDEKFKPEFCETFHDIIRFAHQKAMQEMFKISEILPEGVEAVRLIAGIPLAVYVIDLGGGIEGKPEKLISDNISSIPLKAFLKGMSSVEWPEPRHVDVKGFLGMIAHTASLPEEELEQMGEKSISFISGEYMNFSIRLGYHLSVAEAYTGGNINDNYIRFFFKGGGADRDRRLRRIVLISEILKKMGFSVKIIEDIIDAVITKYKKSHLEEKLEILGRLTVYTKQMDAIMYDDASTELYMEEFIKEHVETSIKG